MVEHSNFILCGSMLRVPAQAPFEAWVDFMLMDDWQSPSSFSLWICSGKQAGLPLIRIPQEATNRKANAVHREWLVEHWQEWIHADSRPVDVYIRPPYEIRQDWKSRD